MLCAFKLEQPACWPEYGSYLMMELLEVSESKKLGMSSETTKELYIRFSLNGELLKSQWEKDPSEMILLTSLADKLRSEVQATEGMTS